MSRILVLYHSRYGATERYARWIAEETGAELADARKKKYKYKDLLAYDTIVYGGGIYSGGIRGVDLITGHWADGLNQKNLIVFGVGIAVDNDANRQQCLEINFEQRLIHWVSGTGDQGADKSVRELLSMEMMPIQCFFLPGAYDPSRVKGLDRHIMALTRKMMDDGAGGSRIVRERIDHGCDLVDRSLIRPIVEQILQYSEEKE